MPTLPLMHTQRTATEINTRCNIHHEFIQRRRESIDKRSIKRIYRTSEKKQISPAFKRYCAPFAHVQTTNHQVRNNYRWCGKTQQHNQFHFFGLLSRRFSSHSTISSACFSNDGQTVRANFNNTCHNNPTTTGANTCAN